MGEEIASPQAAPPPDEKPGGEKPKNGTHAALGHRLPSDWKLPDEYREWAIAAYPELDPQKVVRMSLEFRDYWSALPGQKARKTNWLATWRNDVRRKMGDT